MRRRSRAGGKPIKARRRKAATLRRPIAPKGRGRRKPSGTNANTKIALFRVISASPGDLKPIFNTMLENAVRLCEAKFGFLYLNEGGAFRIVAAHNVPQAFSEARRRALLHPPSGGPLAELIRTKQTVQVADLAATRVYAERSPPVVDAVELGGIRTQVIVPLLKDNELIGVIGIFRQEVRPFTDKQLALLTNFASQAVIAIENTRLLNELRESLENQTASADILRAIASSPESAERALDVIAETTARRSSGPRM